MSDKKINHESVPAAETPRTKMLSDAAEVKLSSVMDEIPSASTGGSAGQEAHKLICTRCGHELRPQDEFTSGMFLCQNCGNHCKLTNTELASRSTPAAQTPPQIERLRDFISMVTEWTAKFPLKGEASEEDKAVALELYCCCEGAEENLYELRSLSATGETPTLPQVVLDSPICTICGNHSLDARFHHAPTGENQCGFASSAGSALGSGTSTTTQGVAAETELPHTSTNTPAGTADESSISKASERTEDEERAERRDVLILGGGDWADASAELLNVPANLDLDLAHKEYRQWYSTYKVGDKYFNFTEWLRENKNATDSSVESYYDE